MLEYDQLPGWLADHYALQPSTIRLLRSHPDRRLWDITAADGTEWSVRLLRTDAPLPAWLNVASHGDWLQQQAMVLAWCSRVGFPAPRVLPTDRGDPTGRLDKWHVLVMEYVVGARALTSLPAWLSAARLLGQLHHLGAFISPAEHHILPWSWWGPLGDAVLRARRLFASLTGVPAEWQRFIVTCEAALQQCQPLYGLPETVIHGDVHLGNTIQDEANKCRLIDWEFAGWGIAVLDFAGLLSDCIHYPDHPSEVDEPSIAAVVDGYRLHRPLSSAEQESLAIAIRFGIAFRTAIRGHLALRDGWDEGIQRGFKREQARFAISEAVAQQARRSLER